MHQVLSALPLNTCIMADNFQHSKKYINTYIHISIYVSIYTHTQSMRLYNYFCFILPFFPWPISYFNNMKGVCASHRVSDTSSRSVLLRVIKVIDFLYSVGDSKLWNEFCLQVWISEHRNACGTWLRSEHRSFPCSQQHTVGLNTYFFHIVLTKQKSMKAGLVFMTAPLKGGAGWGVRGIANVTIKVKENSISI